MVIEKDVSQRKWVRSENGWVAGICQSLGERLEIDPNIIRIGLVISMLLTAMGTALVYLVFALILPREDKVAQIEEPQVLGVCYRISKKTGAELPLVRALTVLVSIGSLFSAAIVYVILHFLLDDSPGSKSLF